MLRVVCGQFPDFKFIEIWGFIYTLNSRLSAPSVHKTAGRLAINDDTHVKCNVSYMYQSVGWRGCRIGEGWLYFLIYIVLLYE